MPGSSLRARHTRAPSSVKATASAAQRLISWHEIPEWMKDNEYILSGYRRQTNSVRGCIHSIFAYVHNETVNIHSHLWGALLFAFFLLTFSARLETYPTTSTYDVVGFTIFLTAAVLCLSFSAMFHTMTAHSQPVTAWCHSLDYVGIVVLIVGTYIPCVYYAFYCEPHFQVLYITGIVIAGTGAGYVVLSPKYSSPAYRGARATVFVALGLCGVVPMIQALYSHGYTKTCRDMAFNWYIGGGACYILGAAIYANRFPERWWPGRFDHWGASHQIFHAHVVVAALLHYQGIQQAAHHWHGEMQGTCPAAAA